MGSFRDLSDGTVQRRAKRAGVLALVHDEPVSAPCDAFEVGIHDSVMLRCVDAHSRGDMGADRRLRETSAASAEFSDNLGDSERTVFEAAARVRAAVRISSRHVTGLAVLISGRRLRYSKTGKPWNWECTHPGCSYYRWKSGDIIPS